MAGSTSSRARRRVIRVLAAACVLGGVLPPAAGGVAHAEPNAVHDAQWALETVNLDRVWQNGKGRGVTVAVLDTGVDASHADLRGRVLPGADFGDGSSGDGTHDSGRDHGHGTQVASLIVGTAENYDGDGLVGLAPQARLLPFGVFTDAEPDAGAVSQAVRAAVRRGADVMVLPSIGRQDDRALEAAVRHAIDNDVVLVAGVGDDPEAERPSVPASIPGVVAVTAIDRDGRVWDRAERGSHVVLAAPGVEILAAATGGRYWTGDDTAYAAAWVAGAAALVRGAHPDWTAAEVITKLIDTARGQGGASADDSVGYGVVDPQRAVTDRTRPRAAGNPLLSSASSTDVDSSAVAAEAEIPGPTEGSLRLLLAVAAALAGMLVFVLLLRVVSRTLRPAERGDRIR